MSLAQPAFAPGKGDSPSRPPPIHFKTSVVSLPVDPLPHHENALLINSQSPRAPAISWPDQLGLQQSLPPRCLASSPLSSRLHRKQHRIQQSPNVAQPLPGPACKRARRKLHCTEVGSRRLGGRALCTYLPTLSRSVKPCRKAPRVARARATSAGREIAFLQPPPLALSKNQRQQQLRIMDFTFQAFSRLFADYPGLQKEMSVLDKPISNGKRIRECNVSASHG